jgi:uncharacterized protein YuzE
MTKLNEYHPEVTLTFDCAADVLYVRKLGAELISSSTYSDDCVVLNLDGAGQVTGLVLVYVSELVDGWSSHQDRAHIPNELLTVVDRWFAGRKL